MDKNKTQHTIDVRVSGIYEKIDFNDSEDKKSVIYNSLDAANSFYTLINKNYPDRNSLLGSDLFIAYSLIGLTCEIYLKHLLYKTNKCTSIEKEHKLNVLLYKLNDTQKNYINNTISTKLSLSTSDILREIVAFNDIFIAFRYPYESAGFCFNAEVLETLMSVLNEYCNK